MRKVFQRLDRFHADAVEGMRQLVAIPALSPQNGGDGETRRAAWVVEHLRNLGVHQVETLVAVDERGCPRPSVVARIPGKDRSRTAWVMTHLDVVPAGDLAHWHSDPFVLRVEGERMFARGVEDNGQGILSALLAVRALREEHVTPACDVGLLFLADEECGNEHGILHVLSQRPDLFRPQDLVLVPDAGTADGVQIEVAEKGILWLRFTVRGQQTHGSTPHKGRNTHRAAAHLVVALEELYAVFDAQDPLFDPPVCTFEPTRREENVPNVNTIPGTDVFYVDCRVLPGYPLDAVLEEIGRITEDVARRQEVEVAVDVVSREDAAPATPPDAPIVKIIERAVARVYGVRGVAMGMGGGTVAGHVRRLGIPAVVWSRVEDTAHEPNESALVGHVLGDAKVMVLLFTGA